MKNMSKIEIKILFFIILLVPVYWLSMNWLLETNASTQTKCNQWITLESNVYLKRNALYYLVHKRLIRLFYMSKSNTTLTELTGSLLYGDDKKIIYFNKYSIQKYDENFGYEINSIDIDFKMKNLTSLMIQINGLKEILRIKIKLPLS